MNIIERVLKLISEKPGNERILTIASLTDVKINKTFRLAEKDALLLIVVWLSVKKHPAYILAYRELVSKILRLKPLDSETTR